ncbi:hypothetical protein ACIBF5_07305 [Micromonospora sp. NPDC050417]|uniref:hypothetical protein n=1 Tax=Micromonospora sp. NPDC050417 TaxID=3364280 RepID=UPI0037885632
MGGTAVPPLGAVEWWDEPDRPGGPRVLQGDGMMDATMTSASPLLGIMPAVRFLLVFQRTLTRGVRAGAVR